MEITPHLDAVMAHEGPETHIALSVEMWADEETPISIFRKLADDLDYAFLLESAEGGETVGRYSFIGLRPVAIFEGRDGQGIVRRGSTSRSVPFKDPLEVLKALLADYRVVPRPDLPRFQGGLVGYLGYDCVRYFESVPMSPATSDASDAPPECAFMLTDQRVIVDHLQHRIVLVAHIPLNGDRREAFQGAERAFQTWMAKLRTPRD